MRTWKLVSSKWSERACLRLQLSVYYEADVPPRLVAYFGRNVVGNPYNFVGIIAGACLGMFIIYTPPLQVVFGGSKNLSPLYWLISVAFGILLLVWSGTPSGQKNGEVLPTLHCSLSVLTLPVLASSSPGAWLLCQWWHFAFTFLCAS